MGEEKMKSLISVIVPVYKVEQYLRKCVDSILAQTYSNLEILLVDDGSPDSCGIICDEYAERDARIRVIHKENGGLSDARNAGLDAARGEYIGFVDSDDWISRDMFEYLYEGVCQEQAEITICNYVEARDGEYVIKTVQPRNYSREEALYTLFNDDIKNYVWNKLFRSDLWDNIRFPVGKNFEDILTTYKLFERASRITLLPDAKYYYRIRFDSISGSTDYLFRSQIYQAYCIRYQDASKRYPEYSQVLFNRIRRIHCNKLSHIIVCDSEIRELYWPLLEYLSSFIRENKKEIYKNCRLNAIERRMFDVFSSCTIWGCVRERFYYILLKRLLRSPYYR